ncbi:MAG: hypothetical protein ACLSAP_02335 [Oscillospiraceae bacterium]
MAKKIISMLMVAVLCVGLSGCLGSKDAQTFAYDIASEPKNLDPQVAHDNESLLVIKNIFEGLLAVQRTDGRRSLPPKTTKFRRTACAILLSGPRRQMVGRNTGDGGRLCVTFRRISTRPPLLPAHRRSTVFKCAGGAGRDPAGDALGVEAADTLTLVITLSYSNPLFPERCWHRQRPCPATGSFSRRRAANTGWKGLPARQRPVVLTKWIHDDYLVLRKNEHYRGAKEMSAERVTLYIPDDEEDSTAKRFLNEKTNLAMLTGEEIQSVAGKGYNVDTFENTVWCCSSTPKSPCCRMHSLERLLQWRSTAPPAEPYAGLADACIRRCAARRAHRRKSYRACREVSACV